MSRARASAQVHVVADNIGQAVEDLSWDWGRERRQFWAIDTGTPELPVGRHPLEVEARQAGPSSLASCAWACPAQGRALSCRFPGPGGVRP